MFPLNQPPQPVKHNKTLVTVINTGKSRNSFLQNCLKELCFIAAIHEFEVCAVHLTGSENRIADFLSISTGLTSFSLFQKHKQL
jgi:hypothetical protein